MDTVGNTNRDGIGASIKITPESGPEQYGLVSTSGSYLSASDKRVHFGLASAARVKQLEIRWPSGFVQIAEDVKADRILTVREK